MQTHRHHKDRPCPSPGGTTGTATPHQPWAAEREEGQRPRGTNPKALRTPLPPRPQDEAGTPTPGHESSTVQTEEIQGPCPAATTCYRRTNTMAKTGRRPARPGPQPGPGRGLLRVCKQEGGTGFLRSPSQGVQLRTGQPRTGASAGTHAPSRKRCPQVRLGHKWGSRGNRLPGGRGHCQPHRGVVISALGVPGQWEARIPSSDTRTSPPLPSLLGKLRTGRLNAFLPKVTEQMRDRDKTPKFSLNQRVALPLPILPGPDLKQPQSWATMEPGTQKPRFGGGVLRTVFPPQPA